MEVGAAAAATAGGVGMGLFSYNRGNYMFDQKAHWARFNGGLNMAIAQMSQYKADIEQMTELTVARQDCYHGIAAMGLTILTAIYCPGRVGLHTPPPPGWLMGLAFVNIAGCYLFLGLTLWLAMHASMRADTASTHMLTRFVRLPIPNQGMMDKARKFLSSFEEQPLKEVFRVPFTRHSKAGPGKEGGFNEGMAVDDAAQKRSRHSYDVPAWYKKEKAVDNVDTVETIGSMLPLDARGTAPEHFEAYREIQNEWFPYDVYARLCIFLAFMHLTHCWAYLQIGHQLQENRALFACGLVMLSMFVLQQVILTLDVIPTGLPIHRLGPFGLWFAYFAAAIEYKRWFTQEAQAVGFVLVYIAYAIHIIYTVQLLRICAPAKDPPAVAESAGASWWPGEWQLPSAFQHAVWLVAPPKQLEDGQNDIVGELREAQTGVKPPAGVAGATTADKRADVHRALGKQGESPAWVNVKIGLISLIIAWVWMTFGFTIEVMNQGTAHPSLLNALGMPNNARDPRYRPAKPGHHEPVEVGTGGVLAGPARGVHSSAVERRLQALPTDVQDVAMKLRTLLPYLQGLSQTGTLGVAQAPAAVAMDEVAVSWPAFFEPRHLACGRASAPALVAVSKHGRGVVVDAASGAMLEHFALLGVATHGAIVSATLDPLGLLIATSTGVVLECAGAAPPSGGRWRCAAREGRRLPAGGAVSVARVADGGLKAAVAFDGERVVATFSLSGAGAWLPTGEVRSGVIATTAAFAADGSSLLLGGADGALVRVALADGGVTQVTPVARGRSWSGACELPGARIARLATGAAPANDLQTLLLHEG
mmetsp:Transcript_23774/g.67660  ORF Transcript_23774/g.67660 Transcript_23774/m.67660 type:complete len:818 (+) Transcript_23774:111-2564(+)